MPNSRQSKMETSSGGNEVCSPEPYTAETQFNEDLGNSAGPLESEGRFRKSSRCHYIHEHASPYVFFAPFSHAGALINICLQ